jgi:hypothetical protein
VLHARAGATRMTIAPTVLLGTILLFAIGSSGAAAATRNSDAKPRVVIASTSFALSGANEATPVTLTCSAAACSGSIQMTGAVKITKKVGTRTISKRASVVLARAKYKLAEGKSGRFDLTLTKIGRSALVGPNAKSPLRTTFTASVKGGATARKTLVVSGSQLVGTYALTVTAGSCGPAGNTPGQVMYVEGSAVTDPAADSAGPFTGTASAQGTGYHIMLLQPANEIEDDITLSVRDGGNAITGTGQLNLDAGNNKPCPISFTGRRTSSSVPTPIPTAPTTPTTTTSTPVTTTTTVPSATTTTTAAPPASQLTVSSLEAAIAQQANAVPPSPGEPPGSVTVTCGPPSASLAVGADILCSLFDPSIGGAQEVVQITGSTPSSFSVVAGPGSDITCSSLNAAEQAAFTADGQSCDPG